MFYVILGIGTVGFILSVVLLILSLLDGVTHWFSYVKIFGVFLVSILLLYVTLPSLKQVLTKDFVTTSGICTVDYADSGRNMSYYLDFENGQSFNFEDGPYIDAYGEKYKYYCEVRQTRNEKVDIDYKVYEKKDGKLIAPEY